MPVNIQIEDGNFSLGPDSGFFYTVSKNLSALLKVEADGTVVDTYTVTNSQLRNPVKELHYDGTFFWTLEDLPSNLGLVIKKWRLYPHKTFAFPSVSPVEFRWQDELTLIHGSGIRWSASSFAVEHYHRSFDGSFAKGSSTIRLNSAEHLNVGDVLYLGPSGFGGFVGNEEQITILGVNHTTQDISFSKSGGLENSYLSSDPIDCHKSVFLFNDHSFSGIEDFKGNIVQFFWATKNVIKSDQGAKYAFVTAADFDQTYLSWVRATQILKLDIFSTTYDLSSSLEANLLESDLTTVIPVYDLIADLNGNLYFKLQQKETTEDLGTGVFTTASFVPEYNFQTQSIIPVVNSTAMLFDTRYARPLPSADKINIQAVVRDQFNFPVFGKSVQFTAALDALSDPGTIGTFSPSIAVTNASGIASTQYTPSNTPTDILVDIRAEVL